MTTAKWVCPDHDVRMDSRSTQYGPRYHCPVDGCTVAGWAGATSTPANQETRDLRIAAHAAFDALWREGARGARKAAYMALAKFLGLDGKDTHIGMFNAEQCRKVIVFAKGYEHDD